MREIVHVIERPTKKGLQSNPFLELIKAKWQFCLLTLQSDFDLLRRIAIAPITPKPASSMA